MKLTQNYLRTLILQELNGGQPVQKQPQSQPTQEKPQAEDVLTKNLNLFVSNTSQIIKQTTSEPQVLDLLKKIIGSLKLNRELVSRSLITLGKEMSVQPKGER
jgi:hypothetical protein